MKNSASRDGGKQVPQAVFEGLFDSKSEYERLASEISPSWFAEWAMPRHRKKIECAIRIFRKGGVEALETEPRVVVGTIHSVKGGEADVVFVSPDLSPAFMETYESDNSDQIHRMFYVACTRARETLVLCEPSYRDNIDFDCMSRRGYYVYRQAQGVG